LQFERSGEVKRLYVKPAMRGRKIADGLLGALEEYAVAFGYRTLYLDTKDDLLAAIKFYERHGYERCERYNQNPQATIFMRKGLGTGRPGTRASRQT
jgi:GNAT superfamily N-acetyltransferase